MKKIIITFLISVLLVPFSFSQEKDFPIDQSQLLAYNSSTTYEFLVDFSDELHELCDYFNGSAVDGVLKVYCTFLGGTTAVCLAYNIWSVTCGVNDVIRLTIKGEYNSALYKAATTAIAAHKVFKVVKKGSSFSLMETREYCPTY